MGRISIRVANESDLPAINDIYNHYVLYSTCTYQCIPATLEERTRWFREHAAPYVVTVAEEEGKVVGWASLSRYHARQGYLGTVEDSVYVHHERHRQGIGRALLDDLIHRGRQAGFHTIIASISADQEPSIRLHAGVGYARVGCIRQVGKKFDRWLDVCYMQLML